MANIRDLRLRITSVGNIQKITGAMEMVATTKLRRFQTVAVEAKPYTEGIEELIRGLSATVASEPSAAGDSAPLFAPGAEGKPIGILFIGSDRGLCGAYNTTVGKELDAAVAKLDQDFVLYVVGRKAMAHAERMGYPVAQHLEDFNLEKMTFAEAASISSMLVREFRLGNLSGVSVCFTRFVSMMRYVPEMGAFLPIADDESEAVGEAADVILEPSAPQVMGSIVPRYLETRIYHALLESITSEYASRRFAMTNATEAASDMKTEITREYNRARQQKITSEFLEIVSGAEAL